MDQFLQLGNDAILEPTEYDCEWVDDRIMDGDGYRDMVNFLHGAYEAGVVEETEYRRKLGAVFSYITSLIMLDTPEMVYEDEDGV
jgi:hypothetical protein